MTTAAEKRAVLNVVDEFFPKSHSGRHSRRVVVEIEKFAKKSADCRPAGGLRWQKERKADALLTNNQ